MRTRISFEDVNSPLAGMWKNGLVGTGSGKREDILPTRVRFESPDEERSAPD